MSPFQPDRKRAALYTVPRATRALQVFCDQTPKLILAATAIANAENRLEILLHSDHTNSITAPCALPAPSQIWSISSCDGDSRSNTIATAARRGFNSSAEIWRFEGVETLRALAQPCAATIAPVASVGLDGRALKVCKSATGATKFFALSHTELSLIDFSASSEQMKLFTVSTRDVEGGATVSKLVDACCVDNSSILVASDSFVTIVDSRQGSQTLKINVRKAQHEMKRDSLLDLLPRYVSKLTGACLDGRENSVVYVGAQDGSIRAFDIRTSDMLWKADHARDHWVSFLASRPQGGFVSGGTDGVVKCWQADSTLDLTFPQHDDTVTNLVCLQNEVVSVSYDGRIAINQVAV